MRKAAAEKILLLGVDGMDPRLTRKYVDEGKLPHVKKLIERGACREDLVLLGDTTHVDNAGYRGVAQDPWYSLVRQTISEGIGHYGV